MFDPIVIFLEEKAGVPRVIGFLLSFIVIAVVIILIMMNAVPQDD